MDQTSMLIKNKLFFGAYPKEETLSKLREIGVNVLLDLTSAREIKKVNKYSTKNFEYIKYSIRDCRSPVNITKFDKLISELILKINQGQCIYIHCRGGHGRSGIVCIILVKLLLNFQVNEAITYVNKIHKKRKVISQKALKLSIPQTKIQKQFIKDYFSDQILFYDKNRIYFEFSNFYVYEIEIDGEFYKSTEHYYQSQKFSNFPKYADIIKNQTTPGKCFYLAKQIKRSQYKWMEELNTIIDIHPNVKIDPGWEKKKVFIMFKALKVKFEDVKLKKLLLGTKNKKISEDSTRDNFWGVGKNKKGKNMLGQLLMKIRDGM